MTAGVLRGERARFQLFGDTMNTAAVRTLIVEKFEPSMIPNTNNADLASPIVEDGKY